MNDTQKNTRTLIVSFVIAIMALVPLRMVEISQQQAGAPGTVVLGDQIEAGDYRREEVEVVAERDVSGTQLPVFEAVYTGIEASSCLSVEEFEARSTALIEEIDSGKIGYQQIGQNLDLIETMREVVCAN